MTPENFYYWLKGYIDKASIDCTDEEIVLHPGCVETIKEKLRDVANDLKHRKNVPFEVGTVNLPLHNNWNMPSNCT